MHGHQHVHHRNGIKLFWLNKKLFLFFVPNTLLPIFLSLCSKNQNACCFFCQSQGLWDPGGESVSHGKVWHQCGKSHGGPLAAASAGSLACGTGAAPWRAGGGQSWRLQEMVNHAGLHRHITSGACDDFLNPTVTSCRFPL